MQHSLGDSLDPSGQGAYAHPMSAIRILNPQGHRYTNRRSAKRLIRRGQAAWVNATQTVIRIIAPQGESCQVVIRDVTATGYDRIDRCLNRDELRALPFAGNVDRLDVVAPTARDWPWRVSTNRRTRKLVAS